MKVVIFLFLLCGCSKEVVVHKELTHSEILDKMTKDQREISLSSGIMQLNFKSCGYYKRVFINCALNSWAKHETSKFVYIPRTEDSVKSECIKHIDGILKSIHKQKWPDQGSICHQMDGGPTSIDGPLRFIRSSN